MTIPSQGPRSEFRQYRSGLIPLTTRAALQPSRRPPQGVERHSGRGDGSDELLATIVAELLLGLDGMTASQVQPGLDSARRLASVPLVLACGLAIAAHGLTPPPAGGRHDHRLGA
jgi:hypothetical protein